MRKIVTTCESGCIEVEILRDEKSGHDVFTVKQMTFGGMGIYEEVVRGIVGMKQGASWPILNKGHRK